MDNKKIRKVDIKINELVIDSHGYEVDILNLALNKINKILSVRFTRDFFLA